MPLDVRAKASAYENESSLTGDRITPPSGHPGRYRAPDSIIAFLDDL